MDLSCNPKLASIIKAESVSAEWREGWQAFQNQEALCMRKGQDWAMGWLTARLALQAPSFSTTARFQAMKQ